MEWNVQQIQGDREYQEDRYHIVKINSQKTLFAIFDGHGNASVSSLLAHEKKGILHRFVTHVLHEKEFPIHPSKATALFHDMDRSLYDLLKKPNDGGSTALIVGVDLSEKRNEIHVWNVGDSRAVVYDENKNIVKQTRDHKPIQPKERARIVLSGGTVSTKNTDARVTSEYTSFGYSTSRAMGDFELKRNFSTDTDPKKVLDLNGVLSSTPDVFSINMTATNAKWIVLASDGLWDLFSSEELGPYLLGTAKQALQKIMKEANNRNPSDNVSVIVVKYQAPRWELTAEPQEKSKNMTKLDNVRALIDKMASN